MDDPAYGEQVTGGAAPASTAGDPDGPVPLDRARKHRREWQVVILAALLVVAAVGGWRWWQDHRLVGTTTPVTLSWTCYNLIFWTDPNGDRWLVGDDVPPASGDITMTLPAKPGGVGPYTSTGSLHVDTPDTATFAADNGAVAHLRRQPPGRFYNTACALR